MEAMCTGVSPSLHLVDLRYLQWLQGGGLHPDRDWRYVDGVTEFQIADGARTLKDRCYFTPSIWQS